MILIIILSTSSPCNPLFVLVDSDLLPLQSNLAHLAQPPSTDPRGSHHQPKTGPEDSTVSHHQSLRRAFIDICRTSRHSSRNDSEGCQSNGRAELRNSVEYCTSETLGFGAEGICNDQVCDGEDYCREKSACYGRKGAQVLVPSAESGPRRTAQKAQYHHDQVGSMIAMSNGDPALRTVVTSTK